MRKIILFISLLLVYGCANRPANYSEVMTFAARSGYDYTAMAESKNFIGKNAGAWGASKVSQSHANQLAIYNCFRKFADCVITYEGSNFVYNYNNTDSGSQISNLKNNNTYSNSNFSNSGDLIQNDAFK